MKFYLLIAGAALAYLTLASLPVQAQGPLPELVLESDCLDGILHDLTGVSVLPASEPEAKRNWAAQGQRRAAFVASDHVRKFDEEEYEMFDSPVEAVELSEGQNLLFTITQVENESPQQVNPVLFMEDVFDPSSPAEVGNLLLDFDDPSNEEVRAIRVWPDATSTTGHVVVVGSRSLRVVAYDSASATPLVEVTPAPVAFSPLQFLCGTDPNKFHVLSELHDITIAEIGGQRYGFSRTSLVVNESEQREVGGIVVWDLSDWTAPGLLLTSGGTPVVYDPYPDCGHPTVDPPNQYAVSDLAIVHDVVAGTWTGYVAGGNALGLVALDFTSLGSVSPLPAQTIFDSSTSSGNGLYAIDAHPTAGTASGIQELYVTGSHVTYTFDLSGTLLTSKPEDAGIAVAGDTVLVDETPAGPARLARWVAMPSSSGFPLEVLDVEPTAPPHVTSLAAIPMSGSCDGAVARLDLDEVYSVNTSAVYCTRSRAPAGSVPPDVFYQIEPLPSHYGLLPDGFTEMIEMAPSPITPGTSWLVVPNALGGIAIWSVSPSQPAPQLFGVFSTSNWPWTGPVYSDDAAFVGPDLIVVDLANRDPLVEQIAVQRFHGLTQTWETSAMVETHARIKSGTGDVTADAEFVYVGATGGFFVGRHSPTWTTLPTAQVPTDLGTKVRGTVRFEDRLFVSIDAGPDAPTVYEVHEFDPSTGQVPAEIPALELDDDSAIDDFPGIDARGGGRMDSYVDPQGKLHVFGGTRNGYLLECLYDPVSDTFEPLAQWHGNPWSSIDDVQVYVIGTPVGGFGPTAGGGQQEISDVLVLVTQTSESWALVHGYGYPLP